jgi:hypothetical protein
MKNREIGKEDVCKPEELETYEFFTKQSFGTQGDNVPHASRQMMFD